MAQAWNYFFVFTKVISHCPALWCDLLQPQQGQFLDGEHEGERQEAAFSLQQAVLFLWQLY